MPIVNGEKMKMKKNISSTDLMNSIEKSKDRAFEAKIEKNIYLGEYKERVIAALTFSQVKEKGIYPEIEDALGDKAAKKLLISRELGFDYSKKYIEISKRKNIPYKLVDSIVNTGEIGLVVASDDAIENPLDNPIVKTAKEKFKEAGLPDIYFEALEKSICDFHMDIIKKEMPEYEKKYKELNFLDKLFGAKCPICQKLGGKKRG